MGGCRVRRGVAFEAMSEYRLTTEIIALSAAKTWPVAVKEWALDEVYEAEEAETCLCGHYPIIELCVLANRVNGHTATVGNCCVKKFIGLPSDKIFAAVKRVRKDGSKSLNEEAIDHARMRGWINRSNLHEHTRTAALQKHEPQSVAAFRLPAIGY